MASMSTTINQHFNTRQRKTQNEVAHKNNKAALTTTVSMIEKENAFLLSCSRKDYLLKIRKNLVPGSWDNVNDDEILLRLFDMNQEYGPCTGVTRKQRWLRAQKFNKNPPQNIMDMLKKPSTKETSLWENIEQRIVQDGLSAGMAANGKE